MKFSSSTLNHLGNDISEYRFSMGKGGKQKRLFPKNYYYWYFLEEAYRTKIEGLIIKNYPSNFKTLGSRAKTFFGSRA